MSSQSKPQSKSSFKEEKSFFTLLVFSIIALIIVSAALIYVFFSYGVVAPSEIGQIGAFFGGWLTPIVGFFVASLLVLTIRFQIHQLTLSREALVASSEVQQQIAQSQQQMMEHAQVQFELESSANGLINLVKQTDAILNSKVNVYVDVLNFDNQLPHETRLHNVIDSWSQDLEHGKSFEIKYRHDRDEKTSLKYLHNVLHELYICQTLVKHKGWVYISPYLKSIIEHVETIKTLNQVKLVTDKDFWQIKVAVHTLLEKLSGQQQDSAILNNEIIAKLMKNKIEELYRIMPTPVAFEQEEQRVVTDNANDDEESSF